MKNYFISFWDTFKKSLTDSLSYSHFLKWSWGKSLLYLYTFFVFTLFISSSVFAYRLLSQVPKIPSFVQQVRKNALSAYPNNLEVRVRKGVVSTNVKEPYYLDISSLKNKGGRHFLVINTKASVNYYNSCNCVVLLTKDALVYPKESNSAMTTYQVTQFEKDQSFTINKKIYNAFLAKVLPYLNYAPALFITFTVLVFFAWPFVGSVFLTLGQVLYLLVMSVLLWFLARLMKKTLTFVQVHQLGLHALTLPVVLTTILGLFGVEVSGAYTIVFLLWMIVVFTRLNGSLQKTQPHTEVKAKSHIKKRTSSKKK